MFAQAPSADWPMFGQGATNNASSNQGPTTANVANLQVAWTFTTGGDVSARAAVVDGVAYFPDWGGNLWAVNAKTGALIWGTQLSSYGLAAGTVSRTSPAVANGVVYIGTQYVAPAAGSTVQPPTGWLLAIDAASGNLLWKIQPDTSNPFPVITGSPAVVNGVVYVGMTSNEEFAAAAGSQYYACCSVRGSIVAVSVAAYSPHVLWQTFTVPVGYSGGAVWGSTPVVDLHRETVFVGTGNNYSVPTAPAYNACIKAGGTEAACLSPGDHADSIIALNMNTGHIKWATRLMTWGQYGINDGSDSWNVDCIFAAPGTQNCPASSGPDYDFGSGPNEITYTANGSKVTIIGAGQKSGIYYALNPDTGYELWHTQVGPGSSLGGMEWGSATDGANIYVAISNLYGIPYAAGSAGSFAALNPATGSIVWQVADPNGAVDLGPMTVSNGVVYAASMGGAPTAPTMLALNASTGSTLWSFAPGSSVNAGATIAEGMIFWGSGYAHLGIPGYTGNNQFFAFAVPQP
jgi:polyvinyl alcohol dehydrogenase (cytochrome)